MTTAATPLEYATPARRTASGAGKLFIAFAAVLVGFVGANPFADAVGFPIAYNEMYRHYEPEWVVLRVGCGVLIGLFTMALLPLLMREGRAAITALGRTSDRPATGVAITLIITGAACLIAALAIPLYFAKGSSGMNVASVGRVEVVANLHVPLVTHLLTLMTFLVGMALIGIGIWGSIRPAPRPISTGAALPASPPKSA